MSDIGRQNSNHPHEYRETIRLTEEDRKMIDALAEEWGMKRSAAVRFAIRKAYKAEFPAQKQKGPGHSEEQPGQRTA